MMYLFTEQEHAQIVRIIGDASWHIPESSRLDRDAESALAMLKAMKPVEPLQMYRGDVCYRSKEEDQSFNMLIPAEIANGTQLYAKEQQ